MKQKLLVRTSAIALTAVAIAGFGSYPTPSWAQSKPSPSVVAAESSKQLVDEVWQIVERKYIDTTFNGKDWKALRQQYLNRSYTSKEDAYKAIREMLEQLGDTFTRFYDPQEFKALQVDSSRDSAGVGLQLIQDKTSKELVVITPIEEAPAFKAGILPGDVVVKINGASTQGMSTMTAVNRLRGKPGTSVALTVRRGQKEQEFRISREHVEVRPVRYRSETTPVGKIGYIRLTQFSASASQEMQTAIKDLERQQVAGYILDLRTNPGGLLYSSFDIARMWLQEGTIVSTLDRQKEIDRQVANQRALTDKPLIILVNEGTASASEIVAAALQENQRAIVVGSQTSGYNSIQSVRGLQDGSGLAVTVARWRTPKERDIGKSGITPDIVVNLTPAQQQAMMRSRSAGTMADPQYAKAVERLTQLIKK